MGRAWSVIEHGCARLPLAAKRAWAILLAGVIFLIDSLSSLDVAIAVLYIMVILMSVELFSRRGLLRVACLCIGLTLIAFFISHGLDWDDESFGRGLISLAAILIAALLALKSSTAKSKLREQVWLLNRSEAFLSGAQRLSLTGSIGFLVPCAQMYWSEQACRIFEFDSATTPTLEQMVSRIHPDDRERFQGAFRQVCASREPLEVEFRLVLAGGRCKNLRMLAQQYEDAGRQSEFVGALMDVTATRLAEEALHRSQTELAHITRVTTLGELAASIAHEVNQPLAAVITDAESGLRWLNRAEPDYQEVRRVIERVVIQAQRAGDVVKKVRALSRKTACEHDALNLGDVVEESVSLLRREIERHHVTLQVEADGPLACVSGDRVQLQQVIINLLVNAMQSMAGYCAREKTLHLRLSTLPGGDVAMAVRDSGPGISAAHLPNLFEPFFTTKPNGMGMGLSICRSIIEAHGGRIWASSEGGEGAVFNISLPVSTQSVEFNEVPDEILIPVN